MKVEITDVYLRNSGYVSSVSFDLCVYINGERISWRVKFSEDNTWIADFSFEVYCRTGKRLSEKDIKDIKEAVKNNKDIINEVARSIELAENNIKKHKSDAAIDINFISMKLTGEFNVVVEYEFDGEVFTIDELDVTMFLTRYVHMFNKIIDLTKPRKTNEMDHPSSRTYSSFAKIVDDFIEQNNVPVIIGKMKNRVFSIDELETIHKISKITR